MKSNRTSKVSFQEETEFGDEESGIYDVDCASISTSAVSKHPVAVRETKVRRNRSIRDRSRLWVKSIRNIGRQPSLKSTASGYEKKPGFGLVNFFTLKILFWDILISIGDVVSDFCQGIALFKDHWQFGLLTIGINWLPGIAAAVHLVSMYRTELKMKKTMIFALLLLLFYPIVPVLAFFNLLWRKPKRDESEVPEALQTDSFKKEYKQFRRAEYNAMISHAISGGIESPIQFVLQVYLILSGKVPKPWEQFGKISISDLLGNKVHLPTTATISLIFSAASIFKAVIEFNIIRVHIEGITSWDRFTDFLVSFFDHLPYLAASSFFRITSIAFLLTYFTTFAFIPVGLFWLSNLFIAYRRFKLDKVPLWLISFISLFFPLCFTTDEISTDKDRDKMIRLQYKTFRCQSIWACCVYIPALIGTFYVINFHTEFRQDPSIILANLDFNVGLVVIGLMGLVQLLLSLRPSWQNFIDDACNYFSPPVQSNWADECDGRPRSRHQSTDIFAKHDQKSCFPREKLCIILKALTALVLIFIPVILPNVVLEIIKPRYPFLYYHPIGNESYQIIVQGVPLSNAKHDIEGFLKVCYTANKDNSNIQHQHDKSASCLSNLKPTDVVQIQRDAWPKYSETLLSSNVSAIIIADQGMYKPSAYMPDLGNTKGARIPVILVQEDDLGYLPTKEHSQAPFHIVFRNESISLPKWDCVPPEQPTGHRCLTPEVIPDEPVNGTEYRRRDCYWGGKACFGFTNKLEQRPFCQGPFVYNRLCDINKWTPMRSRITVPDRRNLYYRINPKEKDYLLPDYLKDCKWSSWIDWEILEETKNEETGRLDRERRRYCDLKREHKCACYIEEIQVNTCCFLKTGKHGNHCVTPTVKECNHEVTNP